MSKRVPNQRDTIHRALALCAFALVICTLFSGFALAARPSISIERTYGTFLGTYEFVDLSFDPSGTDLQISGFDLLIVYDAAALSFMSAAPGSLLTDCGWQYFTYRIGPFGNCGGPCPSGMVRITAMGDDPLVAGQQSCDLGQNGAGTLAITKFYVSNDQSFDCQDVPIRFYWNDCGDNVLATSFGDSLLAGDTVFWGLGTNDYYPVPAGLYSDQGMPETCLSNSIGDRTLVRGINFHAGNVSIVCDETPLSVRGDLNLNAIPNEVADAVLFANYYFDGTTVFSMEQSTQIAASDINANGLPLEFRDLIYLLRIIVGDALPLPKRTEVDTLTALFTQNTFSKYVRVESPHALAGAVLDFNGEITPDFLNAAPGNFFEEFQHQNGGTRILIAGSEPGHGSGGIWFSYTGAGSLVSAITADFSDSPIEAQIAYETAPPDCGDLNLDHRTNISDAVRLINYIFDIYSNSFNIYAADVNCDQMITISDAVYLVRYIFAGGPAPCSSCR
jgi:hypothetical protein